MKLLASLIALAAVTASFGGTFSTFDSTVSNTANLGSNSTFVPVNTAVPTITGTVAALQTLTAHPGTWRSNLTVTPGYQWQVCTSLLVATCVNIPGATSLSYVLGALPIGSFFRVVETATNSYGSASATSGIIS